MIMPIHKAIMLPLSTSTHWQEASAGMQKIAAIGATFVAVALLDSDLTKDLKNMAWIVTSLNHNASDIQIQMMKISAGCSSKITTSSIGYPMSYMPILNLCCCQFQLLHQILQPHIQSECNSIKCSLMVW